MCKPASAWPRHLRRPRKQKTKKSGASSWLSVCLCPCLSRTLFSFSGPSLSLSLFALLWGKRGRLSLSLSLLGSLYCKDRGRHSHARRARRCPLSLAQRLRPRLAVPQPHLPQFTLIAEVVLLPNALAWSLLLHLISGSRIIAVERCCALELLDICSLSAFQAATG